MMYLRMCLVDECYLKVAGDAMKYFTTVLQHGPFAQNVEEIIVRKVYELNKSLEK